MQPRGCIRTATSNVVVIVVFGLFGRLDGPLGVGIVEMVIYGSVSGDGRDEGGAGDGAKAPCIASLTDTLRKADQRCSCRLRCCTSRCRCPTNVVVADRFCVATALTPLGKRSQTA